jgi:hypothetical protein
MEKRILLQTLRKISQQIIAGIKKRMGVRLLTPAGIVTANNCFMGRFHIGPERIKGIPLNPGYLFQQTEIIP